MIKFDTMATYFYNTYCKFNERSRRTTKFLMRVQLSMSELYGRPRLCGTYATSTTDICCHLGIDSVTGRVLSRNERVFPRCFSLLLTFHNVGRYSR